jgi:excisionase family DNA binding protein
LKATKKLSSMGSYYTIASMAEALGVSPHTLDGWCREHGVKLTKLGSASLVRLEDLDSYRARIANVRKLLEAEHAGA